jgi:hypothetical protein
MPIPRRDFMKVFGISLGSLLLARCQVLEKIIDNPTCYVQVPLTPLGPSPTPTAPRITCYATAGPMGTPTTPAGIAARGRLRLCWLRFGELAQKTSAARNDWDEDWADNALGREMIEEHRRILDELLAAGEITAPVSDLIQEAYGAAVYHIWRSNAPMTCYIAVAPMYAPAGADNLVVQSEALTQVAEGGTVAPETLRKIRQALEHDLAFYALTDEEVQDLYKRLLSEYGDPGETLPAFEDVEVDPTPEVKAAAAFLMEVLTTT